MLDIKYIIDNQNQVKESLTKKGFPSENVDNLISTYLEMNKLKTSSQALAEEKNRLSNSIMLRRYGAVCLTRWELPGSA